VTDLTKELNDLKRENALLKETLGASHGAQSQAVKPAAPILKQEPPVDMWKQVSSSR